MASTRPTASCVRPSDLDTGKLGRREFMTMVSAIMALMAVAIDLMLPAFDDIREAFDLREGSADTGRVVTFFFFGLAAAQAVWGPLADRFGRKPILYAGIAVYVVGAVGSALAPTFGWLLASRFVWGVGAAGSRVVATAIVRDRFEGTAMAKAMSQIMAVFVLVPVFAPALGAAIILVVPWQGVFWFCVLWAAMIVAWSRRLPETLDPAHQRPISIASMRSGFAEVITTPLTAGYTIATVFLQGVFTVYLASSEVIIGDIFGYGDAFPLVFGAVALMFGVTALLNGRLVDRYGVDRVVRGVLFVNVPMCGVLTALALADDGGSTFWLFMPTLAVLLSSNMFLMPNLSALSMTPMGHIAGTASALTSAIRLAVGAVFGTLISSQITTTLTPFALGLSAMYLGTAIVVTIVRTRETRRESIAVGDAVLRV